MIYLCIASYALDLLVTLFCYRYTCYITDLGQHSFQRPNKHGNDSQIEDYYITYVIGLVTNKFIEHKGEKHNHLFSFVY